MDAINQQYIPQMIEKFKGRPENILRMLLEKRETEFKKPLPFTGSGRMLELELEITAIKKILKIK